MLPLKAFPRVIGYIFKKMSWKMGHVSNLCSVPRLYFQSHLQSAVRMSVILRIKLTFGKSSSRWIFNPAWNFKDSYKTRLSTWGHLIMLCTGYVALNRTSFATMRFEQNIYSLKLCPQKVNNLQIITFLLDINWEFVSSQLSLRIINLKNFFDIG